MPKLQIADKPTLDAVYNAVGGTNGAAVKRATLAHTAQAGAGEQTISVLDVTGRGQLITAYGNTSTLAYTEIIAMKITIDDTVIYHHGIYEAWHANNYEYYAKRAYLGVWSLTQTPLYIHNGCSSLLLPGAVAAYNKIGDIAEADATYAGIGDFYNYDFSPEQQLYTNNASTVVFRRVMMYCGTLAFEKKLKVEVTLRPHSKWDLSMTTHVFYTLN